MVSERAGRRVALLHNPAAGGGRGREVAAAFVARFGPTALVLDTPAPGETRDVLIERLRGDSISTLCIAGGDGTLHLALNVVLAARGETGDWPRLVLLPTGSANDGARALAEFTGRAVVDNWRSALAALPQDLPRAPSRCRSDVGIVRAGDRVHAFANFAAAGSPADWAEASARRWLAPIKRLSVATAYQLCNLEVIVRRRIHTLEVGLDGAPRQRTELFAWFAANARFLGGGLDLGADVRLDSGHLAVVALPRAPRHELVRLLNATKRGQGPPSSPAQRIDLHLPTPARLNLDGELVTLTNSEVALSVLPGRAQWL